MTNALTVEKQAVVTWLYRRITFVERGAYMVHDFLNRRGFTATPEKPSEMPRELYLELWGILQIAAWEEAGLRPFLPEDLPDAKSAYESFVDRFLGDPEAYSRGATGCELSKRVTEAWSLKLDGAALDFLQIDVAVTGQLPDVTLEQIAEMAWKHRHLGRSGENV